MVVEASVPQWPALAPDLPAAADAEIAHVTAPSQVVRGPVAARPTALLVSRVYAVPVVRAVYLKVIDARAVVLPPSIPLVVIVVLNILPVIRTVGALRTGRPADLSSIRQFPHACVIDCATGDKRRVTRECVGSACGKRQ